MTTTTAAVPAQRRPELAEQTVVVIGGSGGIGLETARRARSEGADVILTGRNPDRLGKAAAEVGARDTAAFDAKDTAALARFFQGLPDSIDHVMITASGPSYGPLLQMDPAQVPEALSDHLMLALEVTRCAVAKMRPGGTLVFMGFAGAQRVAPGLGIAAAAGSALPRSGPRSRTCPRPPSSWVIDHDCGCDRHGWMNRQVLPAVHRNRDRVGRWRPRWRGSVEVVGVRREWEPEDLIAAWTCWTATGT